jgi:hypothetical protein
MSRISIFALMLVFCAATGFGQTALATITGTIVDPTGATIADAPIEVRNLDNGNVFRAGTSETGNFNVSQLPIGDYTLTVAMMGFKTFVHANFHLAANQTLREDIRLELGPNTESITVSADASLLKTESSELVHNVTLSQLNNLPILIVGATNQGYRDPYQAARLIPGFRYLNTGTSNSAVINGTPSNTMQTRLDGQTQGALRNSGTVLLAGATGMTQPSVDALEEVAFQTSNFSAEFGTAGGAVINMVTKSGTNQYHGTVYDYMINEALNAHQPYTGTRNRVRQHNWGFTFGGPVKIPKLYDGKNKTFFFFGYEQYREKKTITNAPTSVPIPAYRQGDFSNLITAENRLITTTAGPYTDPLGRTIRSGTIFDPLTQQTAPNGQQVRDPFPDNKIPLSRFDPISAQILPLIPLPTGPLAGTQATNNYQPPTPQSRISYIPSIKIDQMIGTPGKLSVYFHRDSTETPRSPTGFDALPELISASIASRTYSRTGRVNYDHTASSQLLLHFGFGWNDIDWTTAALVTNYDALEELGLKGQTFGGTFPVITTAVNGNVAIGGMSTMGSGSNTTPQERRPAGNFSATYVLRNHTFKTGVEYRKEIMPDNNFSNTTGNYTFGTNWTQQPSLQTTVTNQGFHGYQFASFLLGGMTSATVAAPVVASSSKSQTSLFIQDTWKVTRKLTVDYGLRWDYGTYARESQGRFSSFAYAVPNPAADGRLGARQYESVCNCNFADNYPYAIGPRFGLAYQANRQTVIRAGIGVVYNATDNASGGTANTAFTTTPATGSGQIVGFFKDGIPAGNIPVWPTTNPAASQGYGSVIPMPSYLDPNSGRPARLWQWNLAVQREITRDLVVEAAYVGNRGVWWEAGGLAQINLLRQEVLQGYGFKDFTSATEAALLTTTIRNLNATQRQTLANRGIFLPYPSFPTDQTVRQSLLPFPQYSGQAVTGLATGNTWYDAFQVSVNKRFSYGLSFNVNYNYSKNLDLMSSADPFNRPLGKNLSLNDLPNQLRISGQYEVPQLKNKGIPFLSNKWAAPIFSGWGIGWYLNYQSAPVLARPTSGGNVPISQFLGRGPGGAQQKRGPDGDYITTWNTNWTDYDGKVHNEPIDVNCHCFDPTKTIVLNSAAWENVANGKFASDLTSIRAYRGIRIPQENANFSRNFRFNEGINLNVRVEFQNIFNRMQLPQPSAGGNYTAPPTVNQATGLYSSGFGTIVPTGGTSGMRSGVIVGRLTF